MIPRPYHVIILPQAMEDLDELFRYVRQQSPQNAAKLLDRLQHAAESLREFPHRYPRLRRQTAHGVTRTMPVPPYLIYYQVIEIPPTIRVLTIRHGARKPPSRL